MLYFRILVGDFAFRLALLRDLGRELASLDPESTFLVEETAGLA